MAVSPKLVEEIEFSPPLPELRRQVSSLPFSCFPHSFSLSPSLSPSPLPLLFFFIYLQIMRRGTVGSYLKCVLFYATPFWRQKGFSGQMVCPFSSSFFFSPSLPTSSPLLSLLYFLSSRLLFRYTAQLGGTASSFLVLPSSPPSLFFWLLLF